MHNAPHANRKGKNSTGNPHDWAHRLYNISTKGRSSNLTVNNQEKQKKRKRLRGSYNRFPKGAKSTDYVADSEQNRCDTDENPHI